MMNDAMLCCFGDSNAWGFRPQGGRYPASQRWPILLGKLLGLKVHEAGQPGRTLTHAAPELGLHNGLADWQNVLAEPMVGYVLALGINDLAAGASAEQAADALASYLDAWQRCALDRPLWLVAPAPLGHLTGGWQRLFGHRKAESRRLQGLWLALAERHGIACLDPSPLLTPGGDGLHWSVADHRQVAEALAALCRPRLSAILASSDCSGAWTTGSPSR